MAAVPCGDTDADDVVAIAQLKKEWISMRGTSEQRAWRVEESAAAPGHIRRP
jgi:hypothetical protein